MKPRWRPGASNAPPGSIQSCNIFSSAPDHPQLVCWWHKTKNSGWYAKGLHWHPEGPQLSHLGKRKLRGIIPVHINTWWKGAKRTEKDCPTEHQLKHSWTSENSFLLWVTVPWHSCSGEVMESPSFDILKNHLDMVLGDWLLVVLLKQGGWTRWAKEVPVNLNYSVIMFH